MKFSSTLADIRQLACMGLDGGTVMPVLLERIQKIAPSHFQLFLWVDRNHEISNMYSPDLPAVAKIAKLYLEEFVNKKEQAVKPSFAEVLRSYRGTLTWERFQTKEFFRSEFFNAVLRPLEARHMLGTLIHEGDRALGELMLWRAPRDKPYSHQEAQALAGIIPYLAHATRGRAPEKLQFTGTADRGLVVVNRKGEIEHACPQARNLLFWAMHPRVAESSMRQYEIASLPPQVTRLLRDLSIITQGRVAPVPVLHHRNSWGHFVFRGYWLSQRERTRNSLFGLTIEREEPLALALWSRMKSYRLSLRQSEVCRLLMLGCTYADIARRLSIRPHTVVDHVRAIYGKLDVSARAELVKKFCPDASQKPLLDGEIGFI